MLNGDFLRGFAVGVGVAVVIPLAAVAVLVGRKPLGRALSRGCGMLSEKAREAVAEAGEIIEDLIAETRADPGDRAQHGSDSIPSGVHSASATDAPRSTD